MKKTMAMREHKNIILLVHANRPPEVDDWAAHLEQLKRFDERVKGDLSKCGLLVCTDGGVPNAVQRNNVNTWLKGRTWPVATVSSSALVRAVGTAMSWFNRGMKVYDPKDWKSALKHVHLDGAGDAELTQRLFEDMAQEIGGSSTVAAAFAHPLAGASRG